MRKAGLLQSLTSEESPWEQTAFLVQIASTLII